MLRRECSSGALAGAVLRSACPSEARRRRGPGEGRVGLSALLQPRRPLCAAVASLAAGPSKRQAGGTIAPYKKAPVIEGGVWRRGQAAPGPGAAAGKGDSPASAARGEQSHRCWERAAANPPPRRPAMADSLRRLIHGGTCQALQRKLERWYKDYHVSVRGSSSTCFFWGGGHRGPCKGEAALVA